MESKKPEIPLVSLIFLLWKGTASCNSVGSTDSQRRCGSTTSSTQEEAQEAAEVRGSAFTSKFVSVHSPYLRLAPLDHIKNLYKGALESLPKNGSRRISNKKVSRYHHGLVSDLRGLLLALLSNYWRQCAGLHLCDRPSW